MGAYQDYSIVERVGNNVTVCINVYDTNSNWINTFNYVIKVQRDRHGNEFVYVPNKVLDNGDKIKYYI